MIEFEKKIKIYSYQVQDIYCCDCFFERIASLLFSTKEFTACDEFINILKEKFVKEKFVIQVFSGSILLACKPMIKFILDNKKNFEQVMKRSCITDLIDLGNLKIRLCIVCLIQIIEKNEILKKFKLKEKFRHDYLYL